MPSGTCCFRVRSFLPTLPFHFRRVSCSALVHGWAVSTLLASFSFSKPVPVSVTVTAGKCYLCRDIVTMATTRQCATQSNHRRPGEAQAKLAAAKQCTRLLAEIVGHLPALAGQRDCHSARSGAVLHCGLQETRAVPRETGLDALPYNQHASGWWPRLLQRDSGARPSPASGSAKGNGCCPRHPASTSNNSPPNSKKRRKECSNTQHPRSRLSAGLYLALVTNTCSTSPCAGRRTQARRMQRKPAPSSPVTEAVFQLQLKIDAD